jgi:hypothetical protein
MKDWNVSTWNIRNKKLSGYQPRSFWVQTKILETCFVSTTEANVDVDCGDGDTEERLYEMLDRMSRFMSYVESSCRHAA